MFPCELLCLDLSPEFFERSSRLLAASVDCYHVLQVFQALLELLKGLVADQDSSGFVKVSDVDWLAMLICFVD